MTQLVGHGVLSNSVGFGIGGTFTTRIYPAATGPNGFGPYRTSIIGAPWTVGPVTLDSTTNGGTMTLTGFVHGPASLTSSTGAPGGMVQMVTVTRVANEAGWSIVPFHYFGILTVRVVPEPGVALLLGAGIVGLLILGRHRSRGG
jgi:hypothetical protein